MPKILIAGGNGFIGKHLQSDLSEVYDVLAPKREQLELSSYTDVKDYISSHDDIVAIINGAAVGVNQSSQKSSAECLYENLTSFNHLYQSSSKCSRFIQLGSGAEYCKPIQKKTINEDDFGVNVPHDAYGLAKFYCAQFLENKGIPGKDVNLRLFGVFGSYENYQYRFISNMIVRALLGKPLVIKQNSIFDYVFIEDVVKIIKYFLLNTAPSISYNVTSGQPLSLIELAELVKKVLGSKQEIIVENTTIKEHYSSSNKRLLEFLPSQFQFTPIQDAIEKLAAWYEENLSTIKKAYICHKSDLPS